MKIAILARGLARTGGVGRLLNGYLSSMPAAAPEDEFFVLTDAPLAHAADLPNVTEVLLKRSSGAIFDHVEVPMAVRHIQPDVFLATKNTIPLGITCPVVCVFLDLAYFAFSKAYPVVDNLYMRAMFKRSATRAARLVAISESTRDDIGTFLGKEAHEKTRVVYPGATNCFRVLSSREREEAAARFAHLPRRFILYSGNISPRKNISNLVAAVTACPPDVALVLTGHRTWKGQSANDALAEAGRLREVQILGAQEDEDLVALYNLAAISVYPSLYEGFGFPVLESFACGTPLAASNATSIPEVTGEAALLFDPTDVSAMSEAVLKLLDDEPLRERLRLRGLERVKQFTWQKTALEMLAILRETA